MMPFVPLMSTDEQVLLYRVQVVQITKTKTVKAVFSTEGCSRLQNSRSFRVVRARSSKGKSGEIARLVRENPRFR